MRIKTDSKRHVDRQQYKSLFPQNEVELNSNYYGAEYNISTQIVTNYNYRPRED